MIRSTVTLSIYLETKANHGFEDVYFYTRSVSDEVVAGVSWQYRTEVPLLTDYTLEITLEDEDGVVVRQNRQVYFVQGRSIMIIPADKVKLWWPADWGEPHLYTLRLCMKEKDTVVDEYETRVGIRTVQLERTENMEQDGTGEFAFVVNGQRLFVRGSNWKPLDPLVSEADRKTRSGEALAELTALHCNMVRIWGGGIYEDEAFFRYCDEHGIFVWQDFMFAYENPPTDEWFCELVKKEAEQIILRQRNHPSLAVWCGDNENDLAIGWAHRGNTVRPSHSRISREILKTAVLHYDPWRSYVDSSPYVTDAAYIGKNGLAVTSTPEVHMYPAPQERSTVLRTTRFRFIGEVGPIGFNAITVNERIFNREKERTARLWDSPIPEDRNQSHQNDGAFAVWRNAGREACMYFYGRDFAFDRWDDYTLAINIICGETFKEVIEYCRVSRPAKSGVIWWSLMDMWPMLFNYSVIDCDGNRKLPWYWIRSSQQPFALMAVRAEVSGELCLYAANDTLQPVRASYTVTSYDAEGVGTQIACGICKTEGNTSQMIQRIAQEDTPALWILRWTDTMGEHTNHVVTGKVSFETARRWAGIIAGECGFADTLREKTQ